MKYFNFRTTKKEKLLFFLTCALVVVFLLILLQYAREQKRLSKISLDETVSALGESTITVVTDEEITPVEGTSVISWKDFLADYAYDSEYNGISSITYKQASPYDTQSIYLLSFKMRADQATHVTVDFGGSYTYALTTQWQYYRIPCTDSGFTQIRWELAERERSAYLTDVFVEAYAANTDVSSLPNGTYPVSDWRMPIAEESGFSIGEVWDVITDGDTLYAIGNSRLTIMLPDGSILSTLDGLGNARHLELQSDLLAVASRENGLFLIDVSQKTSPKILGHYDTLEFCNDICFAGKYLIAACRFAGVEIVDISDPSAPAYVNRILYDSECFRCAVNGSTLFVSCWSSREVRIYDISDVSRPSDISTISVDGNCGEAFIDGSLLYIATGNHRNTAADTIGQPGYGTANALEIFDISDLRHPRWLSTANATGCMRGAGYDDWGVKVSNGVAYYADSYNGLYLIDVSDPVCPMILSNPQVCISSNSPNYRELHSKNNYIYPFKNEAYIISPSTGVCIMDGAVIFSGGFSGLYTISQESASCISPPGAGSPAQSELTVKEATGTHYFLRDYDVYALYPWRDGFLVGCENALLLLDSDLNILDRYLTEEPVMDISVTADGRILTAERTRISLYDISNDTLLHVNALYSTAENAAVSQLTVLGDSHVLVQDSWTQFHIAFLSDENSLYWMPELTKGLSAGTLYYKNIVKGSNSIAGITGRNNTYWFSADDNGMSLICTSLPLDAQNGSVFLPNGRLLSINQNRYVLYDSLPTSGESAELMPQYSVDGIVLRGKAAMAENYLVISYYPANTVSIIDLSDPEQPIAIRSLYVPQLPGLAVKCDNGILIPLRHGGILKVKC